MSRLWNNRLVKNRFGQVRSGWIILIAMVAYDRLSLVSSIGIIEVLRKILIATGDINPATGAVSYTHRDVYKRQLSTSWWEKTA